MVMVVDKLIDYSSSKDEELRDISGLGMYSSETMCYSRLIPRSSEDYYR